jgi:hypothetical protein
MSGIDGNCDRLPHDADVSGKAMGINRSHRTTLSIITMELRKHPLLSCRGVHSWPPAWDWLGDGINRHPRGEVGILKDVKVPVISPFNRCYLVMEYKKATYMGRLLVDDIIFCNHLSEFLQRHRGTSFKDIGSLDISQAII